MNFLRILKRRVKISLFYAYALGVFMGYEYVTLSSTPQSFMNARTLHSVEPENKSNFITLALQHTFPSERKIPPNSKVSPSNQSDLSQVKLTNTSGINASEAKAVARLMTVSHMESANKSKVINVDATEKRNALKFLGSNDDKYLAENEKQREEQSVKEYIMPLDISPAGLRKGAHSFPNSSRLPQFLTEQTRRFRHLSDVCTKLRLGRILYSPGRNALPNLLVDRYVCSLRLASHIAKTPDPTLKTAFRRNLRSILGDPADFLADRCNPVPVGSASYVRVSSPMDRNCSRTESFGHVI
ncbi:hypothetical protein SK128_002676 [Halocaridina rubra]|uniref:Uncharacterized protein n=1 Tax=Halocaridina rubra TaxID=373956 RepID=A0AAN8WF49_HALRR